MEKVQWRQTITVTSNIIIIAFEERIPNFVWLPVHILVVLPRVVG